MKTFTEFISESTTSLSISQFPIIAASKEGQIRLPKILDRINVALAAGSIENARFIDLKSAFSGMLDNVERGARQSDSSLGPVLSWAYHNDVSFYQPGHAAGKLKMVQKILKKDPNDQNAKMYADFVTEIATLQAAMEKIKGTAVKRQPAAPEDVKAKYIAPMASSAAGKLVLDTLKELTEQIKIEYVDHVFVTISNILEHYLSLKGDRRALRDYASLNRQIVYGLSSKVFETENNGDPIEFKPSWKVSVRAEAKKAGDFMQEEFMFKNAKKLAKIVELKSNLHTCKIIGKAHVMAKGIGGVIKFDFTDGSNFKVKNSVKWNRSSAGAFFNQFPTTFHDVFLPNGKLMSTPSEQRMIEIFAVTPAE